MDIRYPIGQFKSIDKLSDEGLQKLIVQFKEFPGELRKAVELLSDDELNTSYRAGGWTVRQVSHHHADTQLNAYIRFRLALTEDNPMVKTYDEVKWGELHDSVVGPVELSLSLMESLNGRWSLLMESLSREEFERKFSHQQNGEWTLGRLVEFYGWHTQHHLAQVRLVRA